MYIDKSCQWVNMFDVFEVYTREVVGHRFIGMRCFTKEALKTL